MVVDIQSVGGYVYKRRWRTLRLLFSFSIMKTMYTVGGSYKGSEPPAMHAAMLHNLKRLKVWAMSTIFGVRNTYYVYHIHITAHVHDIVAFYVLNSFDL